MEIIVHRRNTLAELLATPREHGVEVDVRSIGERLVMHHEPFVEGEDFSTWLDHYRHGTLIVNVKEEGLEQRILGLLAARRIDQFFFLDQSFPFLVRTAGEGERRCAVRVSEFEVVESALTLAGRIDWVWVDSFARFPLFGADARRLRQAGFKLCLVSPELQGRTGAHEISAFRAVLAEREIEPDAVCTKWADRWTE